MSEAKPWTFKQGNLAGFGLKEDAEYTLLSLKGAPSGNLTVIRRSMR